jgi:DNA-binding SARP family transcriptional activator/tetratricopeptide (TPR) repeat protein
MSVEDTGADRHAGSAADIALRLLGPFEATVARRPVALGGRRQRAVLARLALARGGVVPVERLIDDLWDGEPPPSALNTVQSYVSNLRRAFATQLPLIERVGPGYRIAVEPPRVDLHRFAATVAEAGAPGLPGGRRLELLDQALALWRGPALADFADDEWARADIVRLDELRLGAMEARFEALVDDGRHAGIVGELEQAVRDHPLRERFCALLMLALYRSGRQADALRAYERTRTYLGEEVGLDPGPDLQRLAGAILEHDGWLDETEPRSPAAAPPSDLPRFAAGPCRMLDDHRSDRPFVGRADALDWLDRQWARVAAERRGSVAIVSGEAGIGKTRLVQRFARRVEQAGGVVLWGRCTTDPDVVYQPVVSALLGAAADVDPAALTAAVAAHPGLAPLLPNARRGENPVPSADRLEVYEAAARFVGQLRAGRPLLVVVDDAQWADAASLHLIQHVLDHHRTGDLLVVGTVRRPAGHPTEELDRLLTRLRRDDRLATLDLAGITADEVGLLLGAMGRSASDDVASAVHDRTAGNPFFIEQLAVEDGIAVPDTVRELLEIRMAGLGTEARSVLLAAAVLGARAELDVLGAVTGIGSGALLDITDEATAAGVLVEDDAVGWVAFPHALVRQTILAGATRNRLARLHWRAAEAIEAQPSRSTTASAVAHHLLDAAGLVPVARRARAALAAADAGLGSMAPETTLEWVDRVDALLADEEGPDVAALRCEARVLASAAHRFLGDRPASGAAAWHAVAGARSLGRADLLAAAADAVALSVAGIGFDIGVVDEALLALLDEALAALGPAPTPARATLLAWSGSARTGLDDPRRDEHSGEAIRIGREAGDPVVAARARLARRVAMSGPRSLDERLGLGAGAAEAAAAAGDVEIEVLTLVLDVVDLLEAGRVAESAATLERLRARLAPLGRPSANAYLHYLDANDALLRGDLVAGAAAADLGLAAGERAHGGNAVQAWGAQQFLLAWARGGLGDLVPLVAQMAEDSPLMPIWRVALAASLAAAGDPAAVPLCAELGAGAPDHYVGDAQWTVAMAMLGEIAHVVDDGPTGAVVAGLLAPFVERVTVTAMGAVSVGHVHRAHGLALAATGDHDAALASLDRAVRAARQAGFHTWLARSLHDRGAVLARRAKRGDRAAADRNLDEAAVLGRRLGISLTLAPPG